MDQPPARFRVVHIVNLNRHMSLAVNQRTCIATFKSQQTTTVAGGTGRFTAATGTFAGTVTGSGAAGRKADGSCDLTHPPLVEVDTVTGTGTLTF